MVFIYHYGGGTHSPYRITQFLGFLNKGGWAGVTLFFILSGFLITGILWDSFGDPHWWRNFFMRRVLRIFPLYYASILLVLLASTAIGQLRHTASSVWILLLFLQNLPPFIPRVDHLGSPCPLFHFWSLAVEEQFYLLWPFLLVLQKTRTSARALCLSVFLFSVLFRIVVFSFVPDHLFGYEEFLLSRAGELAAGAWLAIAYRGPEWLTVERYAPVAAVLGLAGFLYAGVAQGNFGSALPLMLQLGLPSITISFAALLCLALRPGVVQRIFSAGWLRWLGGISYGIYVFHVLLGELFLTITHLLVGSRGPMVQNAVNFIVAAVGSISAAWLSFHFYEQRFLNLRSRFSSRGHA